MDEQIEIEYKVLLEEKLFYKILDDYKEKIVRDYIQVNHYFTSEALRNKKFMLRIREKNGEYEMTLKRPMKSHRLETNIILTHQQKDDFFNGKMINNEIIDILNEENIDLSEVKNLVSLSTHRRDIKLKEGVLSLDTNRYNSIKDYELEFEVNDEKEGFIKFLEIIKPYHIEYRGNNKAKVRRALESI